MQRTRQRFTIDGQDIEEVQEFTYLGAKVCQEGGGMEDLKNRLSKQEAHLLDLREFGTQTTSRR